jgi:ketosteroid isomerase-like protein
MSNTDIIRGAYDAFAAGDVPAVLAVLHDDVEWTQPAGHPYAGTYTGPDAIVQNVLMPLASEWDSFRVEPDALIGEGDQVAARGWLSGTYQATGVAFRARFVHWWAMTGGRATRFEAIEDTVKMAEAVSGPASGAVAP